MSSSALRVAAVFAVLLMLGGTSACRRELNGRPAPDADIFFPLGMTVAATTSGAQYGYVISTNWSQRFNTGWLSVIDLDAIASGNATTPQEAIVQTLLVPSLGGELSMNDDGTLLIATFRANNQIVVFERNPDDGSINCGDPGAERGLDAGDRRTDCDARHVYRFTTDGFDDGFIIEQFHDPYGVRFLPKLDPSNPNEPQTVMVGYLTSYIGLCVVTFLDLDLAGPEILTNQRSIELTSAANGISVQTSAIVAPRPRSLVPPTPPETTPAPGPRYIAIGSRSTQNSVSSATIFSFDFDQYEFAVTEQTDFATVEFNNRARIARIDLRAQSGGFTLADLVFNQAGTRAYAAISYPQPSTASADSIIMLDANPRTRNVLLANDQVRAVVRPEYDVIASLAVPGTPQSVAYVERTSAPPLLVTATLNDNALHFIRVGTASLDSLTRFDRSAGEGPVTVRSVQFAPSGGGGTRDYVLVTSFLSHGITMFDVTSADPSQWVQRTIESSLPDGRRFR